MRNDVRQLSNEVMRDRKLKMQAKQKERLLVELENEVFEDRIG